MTEGQDCANPAIEQQRSACRRLEGRRIFVTGGASGIGLASVRRLVQEGARVVLTDARADALEAACAGIEPKPVALPCNVASEAEVQHAIDEAVRLLGGLDAVVTCAGMVRSEPTHRLTLEQWDTMLRVNLTGTFLAIKHAIPHLQAAGGGAIVTIGSVASVVAAGRTAAYDASKGGVLQLTRAIAVEYVEDGIRANCILPGRVETALAATSRSLHGAIDTQTGRAPAQRLRVPMERAADPGEIAGVVAFLVSDDASFVTGTAIAADGGYTAI